MGVALMLFAALGSIVGAIVVGLLKDEAAAWLPWLHRRILSAALQRVPPEQRERYEEEWPAHVAEYPGKISQLIQCLRLLRAGSAMRELSHREIDRIMATGVCVNGAAMLTSMWAEKWIGINYWLDHLLTFMHFSAGMAFIYCCCWAIWMRPSILRALQRRDQ